MYTHHTALTTRKKIKNFISPTKILFYTNFPMVSLLNLTKFLHDILGLSKFFSWLYFSLCRELLKDRLFEKTIKLSEFCVSKKKKNFQFNFNLNLNRISWIYIKCVIKGNWKIFFFVRKSNHCIYIRISGC